MGGLEQRDDPERARGGRSRARVAWGLGEEPPAQEDGTAILRYLQTKAPPVYDPFCGGGSIPLEAQRLGLRAYGSDLNPVAVLISKALVEIPPKFAGLPPVNPKSRAERSARRKLERQRRAGAGRGRALLRPMDARRGGAAHRPSLSKATLPTAREATVIAWLWARTVRSPDPRGEGRDGAAGFFLHALDQGGTRRHGSSR